MDKLAGLLLAQGYTFTVKRRTIWFAGWLIQESVFDPGAMELTHFDKVAGEYELIYVSHDPNEILGQINLFLGNTKED